MRWLGETQKLILAPLLVMLLLTLLVGGTAYQLTRNWDRATQRVLQHVTEAVILNNIRWRLTQANEELSAHPEKAQATWTQVQEESRMLAKLSPESPAATQLLAFTQNNENLKRIPAILNRDFFAPNLIRSHEELQTLQGYSRQVTTTITISMFALGLILMAITARDLSQLIKQVIRSRDLNITLQEEERRRIAQDLHDGVIQELIDLKRNYQPEKVDRLVDNIRRVCHNLKPQVLDDLGLTAALEFLAEELQEHGHRSVTLKLDRQELAQLPKPYELPLFRVIQELFSNIKRHAQATQASLTLVYHPAESPVLRGYIQDNGQGFDPGQAHRGLGLTGIRERIQQLGGRITMETAPGQGTRFQFTIPITSRESHD